MGVIFTYWDNRKMRHGQMLLKTIKTNIVEADEDLLEKTGIVAASTPGVSCTVFRGMAEILCEPDIEKVLIRPAAKTSSQNTLKPKLRRNGRQGRNKRTKLLEIYGNECHWCGKPMKLDGKKCADLAASLEHLVRLADGGTNAIENLRLAHRKCNNDRDHEHRKRFPRKPIDTGPGP